MVSDELLAQAEKYGGGEDKGREFFVDLASKQVAVARGLGFGGAYLGGHMPAATYDEILDRAARIGEQWRDAATDLHYDRPGEFYLYGRDGETGLSDGREREEYLESQAQAPHRSQGSGALPAQPRDAQHGVRAGRAAVPAGHEGLRKLERSSKGVQRAAHLVEQAAKVPLFSCEDCGDCSLPDIAYVCPEGPCAKNQRNGPVWRYPRWALRGL